MNSPEGPESGILICDPRPPKLLRVERDYGNSDEAKKLAEYLAMESVLHFPGDYRQFLIGETIPQGYGEFVHPVALHFSMNARVDAKIGAFSFIVNGLAYNWGEKQPL